MTFNQTIGTILLFRWGEHFIEFLQERYSKPKFEAQTCTREGDHICRVNGPCNGYPRN